MTEKSQRCRHFWDLIWKYENFNMFFKNTIERGYLKLADHPLLRNFCFAYLWAFCLVYGFYLVQNVF